MHQIKVFYMTGYEKQLLEQNRVSLKVIIEKTKTK